MVTSRDVAQHAGVSQATVSRVLSGTGPVSGEVQHRVRKAVEELGYVKHSGAAAMKTRRTRTVGVVVSEMSNPFFQEVFEALTAHFAAAGLRTMVWHAGTSASDAVAAIKDRTVDGVVIAALSEESEEVRAAISARRPLVLLNRVTDTLEYDCVTSDNAAGGSLVAKYLLHHGRREAVLVNGDLSTSTGRDRRAGFLRTMEAAGAPVPQERQLEGGYSASEAVTALQTYLSSHQPPTAVFCANDAMGIAVLNELHRTGIPVPDQTWVIGYDDVAASEWPLVGLTTVAQSSSAMAAEGAALLISRMEDPEKPWVRRTFEPKLRIRRSTGFSDRPGSGR